MARFFRRALAMMVVGAAAGALTQAVPASADPASCFNNWDLQIANERSAEAVYCAYGEWMGVWDPRADGYAAHGAVQTYHSGTGAWQDVRECWDDTYRHNYGAWWFCDFDFAEGTRVRIRVWSQKGGVEEPGSSLVSRSIAT